MHLLFTIVLSACSFNICNITSNGVSPNTLKKIEEKIRDYVKNNDNDFIMINQYIPSAIKEERLPYNTELDLWTNNKEVVVYNIDGHSVALSSSLMKKLEIDSPNGILSGSEYDLIQGKITSYCASKVDIKVLAKGIANFTNECLKYGITSVCALDGEEDDNLLSLLVFIARRLDIDVNLYPQYMDLNVLKKYENKMKYKRLGGCSKWELDGSVGSFSASFYNEYKNGKLSEPYYDNDFINNKVKEVLSNNIALTCHAIGTKAIDQIINAYKANKNLIPTNGPYARIDHFEFPSSDACDFIANNRIAITFQPGYSFIDKRYIKSYEKNLDLLNLANLAKLKELVDNNILVLGSSDSPVQGINPYDQIHGMVDYYLSGYSISNYEAFKTYTVNPRIALNEKEGILGVNRPATFFISKYDIINMSKDDINKIESEAVYKNGKLLKEKKGTIFELLKMALKKPHKI